MSVGRHGARRRHTGDEFHRPAPTPRSRHHDHRHSPRSASPRAEPSRAEPSRAEPSATTQSSPAIRQQESALERRRGQTNRMTVERDVECRSAQMTVGPSTTVHPLLRSSSVHDKPPSPDSFDGSSSARSRRYGPRQSKVDTGPNGAKISTAPLLLRKELHRFQEPTSQRPVEQQ
jgi:hypothetical protein